MEKQSTVRRFKSNSKRLLETRASSSNVTARAIYENRGSIEHNRNDISDECKAKRVKFTNSESVRPTISDFPKTSEYAFFKKLKEEMGGSYSRPLREDANQIRSVNSNDTNTGTSIPSHIFKYNDRKLRSPLQSGEERPNNLFSFPSPPILSGSDNPWRINSKDEFGKIKKKAPLPCAYVTPDGKNLMLSPFPSISKNSGDEYIGKGIFIARRHKLRQLATNSYPEVGEGCSKGFDLVSALMDRLFPKNYENECFQFENSEEKVMDTTYQLAAIPESLSEEKISSRSHSSTFNFGPCCTDDFPEYWPGSPRNRVISKWDITNSNTSTNSAIDSQNEEMNLFCGLDGDAMKRKFFETVHYSGYQCFENLKQMDRFRYPSEFGGGVPHTLLLGWDSNEEKEQHIGRALATPLNVGYQQTLGDSLNAETIHAPSLRSNYCLDSSLPDFLATRGSSHYEDNYAALDCSHFLSFTPRCLNMAVDFDNCLKQNKIMPHCQDDPWCIGKGFGRKGHLDALPLPRRISYGLGWKLLPTSEFSREDYPSCTHVFQLPSSSKEDVNSLALVQDKENSMHCSKNRETTRTFSKDAFDIPCWFSNFPASLDTLLDHPLLLDYSVRVGSEDIIDSDADDQWKSS